MERRRPRAGRASYDAVSFQVSKFCFGGCQLFSVQAAERAGHRRTAGLEVMHNSMARLGELLGWVDNLVEFGQDLFD
jgi:hypothetical protein